ncbi:MAG: tryptophan synthase subunit beta, partial [Pseudomonadota bacterium]
EHAASLNGGKPGVLHGNRTYLLQSETGQIKDAHSISAGLDYPGIGPEHAYLFDQNRVNYVSATDQQALEAFQYCAKMEGILPALEPAHALGWIRDNRDAFNADEMVVMNLCGRGDKDIFTIAEALDINMETGQ